MRPVSRRAHNPFNAMMVLVIVGVVFFAVYARQAAHESLFKPPRERYERDSSFEFLSAEDGVRLNLFWAGNSENSWTVLYCYGSEDDLAEAMPRLRSYQLKGFNIASFDYRGYGFSEGTPNESNLYEDAEAVYDYLVSEKGVKESKLVVHGRSVGAGIAMELASRRRPARLILESTFTSVYNHILKMKWIPGDMFENEKKVSKTNCPVLLIHGEKDRIVGISHSDALYAAFGPERATRFTIANAGHGNVDEVGGLAYWTSIERFIRGS